MEDLRVAIIGGGAAGFFGAVHVKKNFPHAQVTIFEKSNQVLKKVSISGGGRCNLTNGCTDPEELSHAYPRGGRELKKLFRIFGPAHTMEWFESKGVPLVIQEDNCVFPRSQDSSSITGTLIKEASRAGVNVVTGSTITGISKDPQNFFILEQDGSPLKVRQSLEKFNKVIVTTGGSPRKEGLAWLQKLGHKIEDPVPSLFTFNIPADPVTKLMGVVQEEVTLSIQGSRISSDGILLVTHWGMSGPAVLKLSSYGARLIHEKNNTFVLQVNWTGSQNQESITEQLRILASANPNKSMANTKPGNISKRLWEYLLAKRGFSTPSTPGNQPAFKRWSECGTKGINRLAEVLVNDQYLVKGSSRFREEFVTCGGVSLSGVNMATMESKVVPGLFFAGEVLDIDAITGGYNLQAAWTTAFTAAKLSF